MTAAYAKKMSLNGRTVMNTSWSQVAIVKYAAAAGGVGLHVDRTAHVSSMTER